MGEGNWAVGFLSQGVGFWDRGVELVDLLGFGASEALVEGGWTWTGWTGWVGGRGGRGRWQGVDTVDRVC